MASLKLQLQQHTGEVISINKNGVLDIKLGGLEPENLNPRKGIVKRKAHAHQAKNTDKDSASSIKIYGIVDLSGILVCGRGCALPVGCAPPCPWYGPWLLA